MSQTPKDTSQNTYGPLDIHQDPLHHASEPEGCTCCSDGTCNTCVGLNHHNHFDHIDHSQLMEEMRDLPVAVQDFLREAVKFIRLLGEHNIDPESHPDLRKYMGDFLESLERAIIVHNESETAHPGIHRAFEELEDLVKDAGKLSLPTILEELEKHNVDIESHPYLVNLLNKLSVDLMDHEISPTAHSIAFGVHNEDLNAHFDLMKAHNEDPNANSAAITSHDTNTNAHSVMMSRHNSNPSAHAALILSHNSASDAHSEILDGFIAQHNNDGDAHSGTLEIHNNDIESHPDIREMINTSVTNIESSTNSISLYINSLVGLPSIGVVPLVSTNISQASLTESGRTCDIAEVVSTDYGWVRRCSYATMESAAVESEELAAGLYEEMCTTCMHLYPEISQSREYIEPDGREVKILRYASLQSAIELKAITPLATPDPLYPMTWSWIIEGITIKAPDMTGVHGFIHDSDPSNMGKVSELISVATNNKYGIVKMGTIEGETPPIVYPTAPVPIVAHIPYRIYLGPYSDTIIDDMGNELDEDGNIIVPAPTDPTAPDPETEPTP